jgi:diguanylate cyclase (GGDEF)-like protein
MWLSLVHPDDRATVQAQSDAFIRGEGGDLTDYRMVRPDGRIDWIRDRAYAFRDDDGSVLWEHGLLFDVTELKEAEARVAHLAYHDSLTGLANRQLFEETLAIAMERARRAQLVVAVLYFDLDNFKHVNDSFGHHTGDALLVQLADRLRSCTRDTDLVARQGGDEFLMLLGDLAPETADATIGSVAERIRTAMSRPFDLHDRPFHARGSSGISVYPRDAVDSETMLRNADIAMYRAKRTDPGGYTFYAPDDEATELS